MTVKRRQVLLALLIGALPIAASADAQRPILAFGDSLTAGIGGSGEDYPSRLAAMLGREVINAGVPGDTTALGRERLPLMLAETRPALLILCLGLNDFLRHVPEPVIRANLEAMLAIAADASVPVLLLAVPRPGEARVAPWFAELAVLPAVRVDEHAMADVLINPALKADLVHPDREGYRRVAQALAAALEKTPVAAAR